MLWIWLGLLFSAAIGYAGYAKGALDRSGMVGAIIVGTIIFGLGGWDWGVLLIAFFVSSSLLSGFRKREKEELAEKFSKGSRRDWGQTMANGGAGALIAIIAAFASPATRPALLAAFVGAMATVNADTWATEIGVLSKTMPRLITTGRQVEIGASGGVTVLGTIATMAGGAFIGLLGALMQISRNDLSMATPLFLAGIVGGLSGSLFDSLLGATFQAIYYCEHCEKETERTIHRCGATTRKLRGFTWLNNDLVNLFSSLIGAILASAIVSLLI